MSEQHTIQWRDGMGTWQYPGCSEDEATFDSHSAALAAIDDLAQSSDEWRNCRWRITSVTADGEFTDNVR